LEWELTEAHSFVHIDIYIYIHRPQKSCSPHSYVNFEKKFPKRDFP
jgi:hypothetical protein